MPAKRKLIEVALPLEAINREAAREKTIRHGHPSTLHLWWARRPLAAARAVLFAQLVDDPSSHPDIFPTEEAQKAERERLHKLIERLVVWENASDQQLFAEAHQEILKSTGGTSPSILDPFAGGGSIPLEAQRLGLEAHASDLNPVAVLINKALVEIPPKFVDRPPVFPGLASGRIDWTGSDGLAADVRAYGEWMRDEAESRIGAQYPKAVLPDGTEAPVIAWIWARTVTCPNPACGVEMPLVRSWWLGKKKGRETWARPVVVPDASHPSGRRVEFEIMHRTPDVTGPATDGTVGRAGAECVACHASAPLAYVRAQGKGGLVGVTLLAVAAEGRRQRIYVPASETHLEAAAVAAPGDVPEGELPDQALGFRIQAYGMRRYADLFTARQLVTLTTFCDLLHEVRERALADGASTDYADAVATYLGMTVGRLADLGNALCRWEPNAECPRHLFARQAISMVWDFGESNPLGTSSGSWSVLLDGASRAFSSPAFNHCQTPAGSVSQASASTRLFDGFVLSTDPPYYDNIQYSDLSDFFFVWLRRGLRNVYDDLFSTMLVPKADELVANPYRHGGKDGARRFFEEGFREVFSRARSALHPDFPATVYYAFKQSESDDDGQASTGWETLLDGLLQAGWEITGTWPVRTEAANRMRGQASNALASSIVIALRSRPEGAPSTDRRGLIEALQAELPGALRWLQQGAIAPVDLPQAAIGPGMAVFSRYSRVLENDGSAMTVRSALARINDILDQVLAEQEGDFDPATRFAIAWYRQHGYTTGSFGDADNIARARNTAVDAMDRAGILTSVAGRVTLLAPETLPETYDVLTDDSVSAWEVLHHLIVFAQRDGVAAAGAFLADATERPEIDADLVKELAFLLFSIAEKNGWTNDAIAFNAIATSWPEIFDASRQPGVVGTQSAFELETE